jgi:selenocysteine lyase/cysteine desulfurase
VRDQLYLDHARFGLPTQAVRETLDSLAAFHLRDGLSTRFDDLLVRGLAGLPPADRPELHGLWSWRGIAELRTALSRILLGSDREEVLLAGRTSQLMRAAARLLARGCERVLATDLEWPAYVAILEDELGRAGRTLVRIPISRSVLFEKMCAAEVASRIVEAYRQRSCDGLFLSPVSYLGLKLPVAAVVSRLCGVGRSPELTLVDASQAFCHLPADLAGTAAADLVLAGCHKWAGSLFPLGFMAITTKRASGELMRIGDGLMDQPGLEDPLATFLARREDGKSQAFGETVNLTPLFTARAAIGRHLAPEHMRERLGLRLKNAATVTGLAAGTGWTPVAIQASVRSAILLLRARGREVGEAPAGAVRRRFLDRGVVLTSYEGGWIRLSMPETPLDAAERNLLRRSLRDRAWDGCPAVSRPVSRGELLMRPAPERRSDHPTSNATPAR